MDLTEIPEGDDRLKEQKLFEKGDHVKGMIDRVNAKLGFVDTKLTIVLHLREQVILLITIWVNQVTNFEN